MKVIEALKRTKKSKKNKQLKEMNQKVQDLKMEIKAIIKHKPRTSVNEECR